MEVKSRYASQLCCGSVTTVSHLTCHSLFLPVRSTAR